MYKTMFASIFTKSLAISSGSVIGFMGGVAFVGTLTDRFDKKLPKRRSK